MLFVFLEENTSRGAECETEGWGLLIVYRMTNRTDCLCLTKHLRITKPVAAMKKHEQTRKIIKNHQKICIRDPPTSPESSRISGITKNDFKKTCRNILKIILRESTETGATPRYPVFYSTPSELGDMVTGAWHR